MTTALSTVASAGKRGRPRKHPAAEAKPKKLTRQAQRLKVSMAGISQQEEKHLAKQVKADPKFSVGLSARELQDMRNAEYFRKLNEGEIQENPLPTILSRLVIRDDVLGEPI